MKLRVFLFFKCQKTAKGQHEGINGIAQELCRLRRARPWCNPFHIPYWEWPLRCPPQTVLGHCLAKKGLGAMGQDHARNVWKGW